MTPLIARARHTVLIRREIGDVFGFVTDPPNFLKWDHGLVGLRLLERQRKGVGTRVALEYRLLWRRLISTVEIIRLVPDSEAAISTVSGPIQGQISYSFGMICEGTLLTAIVEVRSASMRVPGPLLAWAIRRKLRTNFVRLKNLLEGVAVSDEVRT